jgi:hypothetical protein
VVAAKLVDMHPDAGTERGGFLSDEWFEAFAEAFDNVELVASASARLAFDAGGSRWHLVVQDGRVSAWGRGEVDEPDCTLQWDRENAERVWHGAMSGNDAHRVTTVATPASDGDYVGPPAPMDLRSRPELDALPKVPGATLRAQYHLRKGPFGDIDWAVTFVDGRVANDELAVHAEPDVTADVTYRALARVRAGEMMILETLQDGRVEGSIGAMALLAGLMESPEYEDAERAAGRHAIALATLGELRATPAVAGLLHDLLTETQP